MMMDGSVSEEQRERSLVQLDGVRIVDDLWEDGDWDKNKKLQNGTEKNPPFINEFIKAPRLIIIGIFSLYLHFHIHKTLTFSTAEPGCHTYLTVKLHQESFNSFHDEWPKLLNSGGIPCCNSTAL